MKKEDYYWSLNGGFAALDKVMKMIHEEKLSLGDLHSRILSTMEDVHELMGKLEKELNIKQ